MQVFKVQQSHEKILTAASFNFSYVTRKQIMTFYFKKFKIATFTVLQVDTV